MCSGTSKEYGGQSLMRIHASVAPNVPWTKSCWSTYSIGSFQCGLFEWYFPIFLDEFVQVHSSIKGKYTGLVDLLLLTKHRTYIGEESESVAHHSPYHVGNLESLRKVLTWTWQVPSLPPRALRVATGQVTLGFDIDFWLSSCTIHGYHYIDVSIYTRVPYKPQWYQSRDPRSCPLYQFTSANVDMQLSWAKPIPLARSESNTRIAINYWLD